MTSLTRRLTTAAAGAVVALLALTACAGGGSGEATPDGVDRVALADEQQNLTFIPNFAVPSLDPTKAPLEMGTRQVMTNVMQALVTLDENSEPQSQIAESWEWTSPTTLSFTLRDDVTFSDGTPLTADDVKASVDRYIAQNAQLAAALSIISETTVESPTTFTITTSAPTGTLVGVLSLVYIGQAAHQNDDDWWSKPIGSGAFVIDEVVPNDHITLIRNENYSGEPAKLKTLTFKLVTDVNAKVTALSNGSAQVINDVTYDQIQTVMDMPNVVFTDVDSLTYAFLWFENEHEPLDDPRVRRAMWEAIDLDTIITSLYGETASAMDSFCPTSAFGCVPANGMPEYDPEHAKELLKEAGVDDGFTVDIIFSTANSGYDSLTSALVSAWDEVGITVEPRALDGATWLSEFSALNWDLDVQPNTTATGDADYTLNRLYQCEAKRLGYCNPELDEIMAQAQASADPAERLKLYQQVVDIMAEDVPAIPLFQLKANVAALDTVQGLSIPATEMIDFSSVYLTE
ncbi:ABC transporter substrate-binding protein [Microbacterium sp. A204]|uniref:ABC transporter substrate-binding protein n=1 Tax=Microbacterium sp. A204 TaxID=3457321 RepID=UPI003FD38C23